MNLRVFQINDDWEDHSYGKRGWFEVSLAYYTDGAPSLSMDDYDYVQIVPCSVYYAYYSGNGGAQAFRHRESGWTFPDYCRQLGGCPEMWVRSKRRQLTVMDSPVLYCLADW